MCQYCYVGHIEHDCNNGISWNDVSELYQQAIETNEWNEKADRYEVIYLEIKFCPYCGRDLYQPIK